VHPMASAFSPGTPVAADAAAIERELRALWESPLQHEDGGAFIRACAGNLMALAGDQEAAAHLLTVLPGVAQQHPLRSLMAYRDKTQSKPGAAGDVPIRAWINAQCSIPVTGGPQVCSEIITLAAGDEDVDALTNLLSSVLIPDLPVYIYMPSFTPELMRIVVRLATWANLLILDSRGAGYGSTEQPGLTQLLTSPPAGIPVRDLEWARLTPWRDLVSQFFDVPERRELPYRISRVAIDAAHPAGTRTCSPALLFAGWLASRLDWFPRSAEPEDGRVLVRCESQNGEVLVSLGTTPSRADRPPRIESVALHTRTDRTFAVTLDRPAACLAAATATNDAPGARHAVPDEEPDEASLLVKELSIAGEDPGFQGALSKAIAINRMLP
jgi:glucose-6-phosphate dehydrogenase assembly protein OpcA